MDYCRQVNHLNIALTRSYSSCLLNALFETLAYDLGSSPLDKEPSRSLSVCIKSFNVIRSLIRAWLSIYTLLT